MQSRQHPIKLNCRFSVLHIWDVKMFLTGRGSGFTHPWLDREHNISSCLKLWKTCHPIFGTLTCRMLPII